MTNIYVPESAVKNATFVIAESPRGGWIVKTTYGLGRPTGFGRLWANQLKSAPSQLLLFFSQDLTGCRLVVINLDQPISYFFFQVPANFFFIVMTTGQELGHWEVSWFSNVAKLWNAIMKHKLRLFVIHQTVTSLQGTKNLNPRTRWYPVLDESYQMKSAYFTIHPGKNPPPQNGCRLKSVFFKAPVSHPPLSQFNRTFTKPTGRHYTKYRFSPDIEPNIRHAGLMSSLFSTSKCFWGLTCPQILCILYSWPI